MPVKECFCLLWRVKQSMYIFLHVAFYYVGYELHFMLEKDVPVVSQRTQCVVPMHPRWVALGHLFPTHQTVNIYRSMQDPQALVSLKCRYYIYSGTNRYTS